MHMQNQSARTSASLWNQPLPYIEGLLFMDFDNVTLMSQKPCLNNNKFDCSETMDATFHNKRRKKDAIAIFYGKNKLHLSC